ncbi:MAG: ribosome silencing factor [Candidatus Bipolaricaulaceae bacterium]
MELARRAAQLILDKKGQRLVLLDLRETSFLTDFFLIAEGENPTHVRAIAEHLQEHLPVAPRHTEGLSDGRWVLLDYGDVVVHLFHQDVRAFYDLEGIWSDRVVEGWIPPSSSV